MEIFIVNQCRTEIDCGDTSTKVIGVATSYEEAMEIFKREADDLINPNLGGFEINNDHQYNWRGNILYLIDYQRKHYCNLTMQIEKANLKLL